MPLSMSGLWQTHLEHIEWSKDWWWLSPGSPKSSHPCPWLHFPTPTCISLASHSVQFSSVAQSCLTLWPHGLQHTSLLCSSPTLGACSNSCPLSWWCHPTISSSVIPISSCLQSFPASGFFKWVSSSHQVAKVLEFQLQHQSFQWIFRTDLL